MKNEIEQSNPGPAADLPRKQKLRAAVEAARKLKEQLVAEGASAMNAQLEASERAATEAKQRGLNFSAGYLYRQMQRRDL